VRSPLVPWCAGLGWAALLIRSRCWGDVGGVAEFRGIVSRSGLALADASFSCRCWTGLSPHRFLPAGGNAALVPCRCCRNLPGCAGALPSRPGLVLAGLWWRLPGTVAQRMTRSPRAMPSRFRRQSGGPMTLCWRGWGLAGGTCPINGLDRLASRRPAAWPPRGAMGFQLCWCRFRCLPPWLSCAAWRTVGLAVPWAAAHWRAGSPGRRHGCRK